jgi:hypothetical protein
MIDYICTYITVNISGFQFRQNNFNFERVKGHTSWPSSDQKGKNCLKRLSLDLWGSCLAFHKWVRLITSTCWIAVINTGIHCILVQQNGKFFRWVSLTLKPWKHKTIWDPTVCTASRRHVLQARTVYCRFGSMMKNDKVVPNLSASN